MTSELLETIEKATKEGFVIVFGRQPSTNRLAMFLKTPGAIDEQQILFVDMLDSEAEERIVDSIKEKAGLETYYAGGWDD